MQWHQLGNMQTICTSLQKKNIHTNTSSLIGRHKCYRNNFAALLIMTRLLTRLVICSLTKIAGATWGASGLATKKSLVQLAVRRSCTATRPWSPSSVICCLLMCSWEGSHRPVSPLWVKGQGLTAKFKRGNGSRSLTLTYWVKTTLM